MKNVTKPNFELNCLYIYSNLSLINVVLSFSLKDLITFPPLSFEPQSSKPNLVMNILHSNSHLSLSKDVLNGPFHELPINPPHLLKHLFQIPKDCKGNHKRLP